LVATAAGLLAQTPTALTPRLGEAGKDVLWLPSPSVMVGKMLDLAQVTTRDVLMDLGSGDGRLVIAAAKRGARAVGVEYNPNLVELSKTNAAAQGVSDRATFLRADLFETDLSKATVITLFLRDDLNLKLRSRLLDLTPGTRIVSNTFAMGEWEPDGSTVVGRDCANWCFAMLWIVPAKVAGTWRLPDGDLRLGQRFQMLTGTLRTRHGNVAVVESRLVGNQITFTAGSARYVGRVSGRTMKGTVTAGGGTVNWSATRLGADE
jgi:SAM-dependent methyltransferase